MWNKHSLLFEVKSTVKIFFCCIWDPPCWDEGVMALVFARRYMYLLVKSGRKTQAFHSYHVYIPLCIRWKSFFWKDFWSSGVLILYNSIRYFRLDYFWDIISFHIFQRVRRDGKACIFTPFIIMTSLFSHFDAP